MSVAEGWKFGTDEWRFGTDEWRFGVEGWRAGALVEGWWGRGAAGFGWV